MHDGFSPRTPVESFHPGQPRFVTVGEPIRDPVFVLRADDTGLEATVAIDPDDHGRDNLAPRLPDLSVSPENYHAEDFEWSVRERPAASDGDLLSFATSTTAIPRYDAGMDNVAEFEADAPGRYVLAPDALSNAAIDPDSDDQLATVSVFVRDGTDQADVAGPDRVLVVVNASDDPVRVAIPDHIAEANLVTDTPATAGSDGDREIEVGTVGVFAAADPVDDSEVWV